MAIKQIVLHIGVEKTGSTSIQQACLANRDRLNDANSFYPMSMGNGNHTKLAIYAGNYSHGLAKRFLLVNSEEEMITWREETRNEFLTELQTTDSEQLILSCEWMAHLLDQEIEFNRLTELLTPLTDNINVVLYIRRQDQLAVSRYSTALKAGHTDPFTFPLTETSENGLYDFYSIYKNWKKHFSSVTVRSFEREHLYKQDLLADFFHLCDLDYAKVCEEPAERIDNPSLSKDGQELVIAFNTLMKENFLNDQPPVRRQMRRMQEFRLKISQLMPGKYQPCSKADAMQFAEMFSESNEKLRQAVFSDRDQLFAQDFSKYPD